MSNRNVLRVPFKEFNAFTTTLSGGASSLIIPLDPTLTARTTAVSDLYNLYRYTQLSIDFYPLVSLIPANVQSVTGVLAYANEILDTAPTTSLIASDFEHRVIHGTYVTNVSVPTAQIPYRHGPVTLKLKRNTLINGNSEKWWKTKNGAATAWEETQGGIYIVFDSTAAATNDIAYGYDVRGVIEFSTPVAASTTPYRAPVNKSECSMECAPGTKDPLDSCQGYPKHQVKGLPAGVDYRPPAR
jgi:hypothetical protein